MTTTSTAIHVPSLQKLDETLGIFVSTGTLSFPDGEPDVQAFRRLTRQAASRKLGAFQRPLFDDRPVGAMAPDTELSSLSVKDAECEIAMPEAESLASILGLGEETSKDLEKTLGRLRRAVAGGVDADVDPPEKSVREL